MTKYLNKPSQVVIAPVFPTVMFCMIMYYGLSLRITNGAHDKLLIIIYGIMLLNVIRDSFTSTAVEIVIGKSRGNIATLMIAPISPLDMVVGYCITRAIRMLIIGTIIMTLTPLSLFGYLYFDNLLIFIAYLLLGSALMTSIGLILSCISSTYEGMNLIETLIAMPMLTLSGTFFTLSDIKNTTLQTIVCFNPLFNIITGARAGLIGIEAPSLFWFIYTLIFTIAVCGIACYMLKAYRERLLPF